MCSITEDNCLKKIRVNQIFIIGYDIIQIEIEKTYICSMKGICHILYIAQMYPLICN